MTRVVTLRDVARRAEVSVATASNALNRPGRVAATTRARVFEAADWLGYEPLVSAGARPVTSRRRIGVIAPFTTYTSYSERLKGILSVMGADSVEPVVLDHPSASRSPSPRLDSLPFSGSLDGLIIMGVPVDTALSTRLIERGLPTVLIDTDHPLLTSIVLDEAYGAQLAVDHLAERGFDRFVYVTEGQRSQDYISQGRKRLTGFLKALADHGFDEDAVTRITARSGDVAAGAAAAELIETKARGHRVGVLAGHDTLAAGVLAGLRHVAVDVPGRVGVVGWDGGDTVEALGLTTIRQPLWDSGRLGVERLIAILHERSTPVERVSLRPVLRRGVTT
ncbi:MAG: LacI family DNA-binding transcriptional regulator [Cellulomonadaceae bacterium]